MSDVPDPALVAWTAAHVTRFLAADPPCCCFACLAHRAVAEIAAVYEKGGC